MRDFFLPLFSSSEADGDKAGAVSDISLTLFELDLKDAFSPFGELFSAADESLENLLLTFESFFILSDSCLKDFFVVL